ncbi:MAG: glutamine-hydrolyzing carbamoyl-phosphate synthase small subunit [Prevotellaceae bacterium]|jgi:carbamoyl-phosphate synthase small subunit|nr:glutamine-hydrolyzing carbamoyl-phosphate synthase small subunit [Prevotellaceae bacterium]
MLQGKDVQLVLDDGTIFNGKSFGYEQSSAGEIVFNTGMVGYPESLSDPSYSGQILAITYPIVGNYGIPSEEEVDGISSFFESEKVQASGLIISDYAEQHSHWNAKKSLGEWLKENKVPGICGVDTRELTKILREKGSMLGKIVFPKEDIPFYDPASENQVAKKSAKEVKVYGNGEKNVVLIDCGVKLNIIRCLLKRGVKVTSVPWNYEFSNIKYDGILISNGPGNPEYCEPAAVNIRKAMDTGKPIFGICMGHQLLGRASGANTFKLKYGHRSLNQPVRLAGTNSCFITSQNHGYAVDTNTLSEDWEPLFVNMNDGTNEGIKHKTKPFFSVQFHPEAAGGPTDTSFLFDDFFILLNR